MENGATDSTMEGLGALPSILLMLLETVMGTNYLLSSYNYFLTTSLEK